MNTTAHTDQLDALINDALPHAVSIRHDLHAHPELGYEETRTAQTIADRLAHLAIDHANGLAGGTGVLAHIPATTNPDTAPTVALRADIDALPIDEDTGKPYTSNHDGRMHACGHDGHTANLLLTAHVLAKLDHRPNNTTLLFQPAEEGGAGADAMIKDGALDGSKLGNKVDAIFGLHGWPELPIGTVATRPGPLLANADMFSIRLEGKGGHAAFPHTTHDPVLAAAHITTALQHIASRRVSPVDAAVVTVAAINAGKAHNVIPPHADMTGTVRTLTPETRDLAEHELTRTATAVAEALGVTAHVEFKRGYPATTNHPGATQHFFEIAKRELPDDRVLTLPTPFMGGEDFAFYTQHCPACFFIVGLNHDPATPYPGLHTPQFDFNDDALPLATNLFVRLATDPLPQALLTAPLTAP